MRRIALLGLCLLASGCGEYASSPFDGFGGFLADTHGLQSGPNSPIGDSDIMRRVRGQPELSPPLLPEPGNVWPGPIEPSPTLQDIERENPDSTLQPGATMSLPGPTRGSSTPPSLTQPGQPGLTVPRTPGPSPTPPSQPAPPSPTIQTPNGAAPLNSGGAVQTYVDPRGGTGLVVPNGNGTSTLIGPDGTVQTVPTPR